MAIYALLALAFVAVTWTLFLFVFGRVIYFKGVVAGYGYAKEPGNPNYQAAGEYLRKTVSRWWPELKRSAVKGRGPRMDTIPIDASKIPWQEEEL